jgi:hypothetical protein
MGRRRWASATAIFAAATFIGACGASDDDVPLTRTLSPRSAPAELVSAQSDARELIYTADLRIRVGDIGRAAARAVAVAERSGGFLQSQRSDLEGDVSANLELKVDPERFDAAIVALGDLGTVLHRSQQAEDVTEQVVDLEGRLRSAEASRDRLRGLLSGAATASDVVAIEKELARREAEVESLTGRLRVLRSRIDRATIRVAFVETGEPEVSGTIPGFVDGVETGWVALMNALKALVLVVGVLVPFMPPVAVLVFGWKRLRRRRSRRVTRPSPDEPPAAERPPGA